MTVKLSPNFSFLHRQSNYTWKS